MTLTENESFIGLMVAGVGDCGGWGWGRGLKEKGKNVTGRALTKLTGLKPPSPPTSREKESKRGIKVTSAILVPEFILQSFSED